MRITLQVLALAAFATALPAQEHHHTRQLGTVRFDNSCGATAQEDLIRSVALLHSFTFSEAIHGFESVLHADPACAMAWWGIALSAWGNPVAPGLKTPAQLSRGLAAVQRARNTGEPTARERGYIEAAARLYERSDSLPQRVRVLAYRDAMAGVVAAAPADTEAVIFHALAEVAGADPTDKTYAHQLAAGATLERLFAAMPEHPGLAHYIIHTYDFPALAGRARQAADRYSGIAPTVSHALHMPSHTFTRVGAWQQSIESNTGAGLAAQREGSTAEQLHAMDYRMYAYLQTGQDRAARQLLDELPSVAAQLSERSAQGAAPLPAGHYAITAIPARWVLERGDWAAAARLEVRSSPTPYAEAVSWFAKGLGAARTGDTSIARAAVAELARLRDVLAQRGEGYWSGQVEIQRLGTQAWLDYAAGRRTDGMALMREATDREAATDKAAVTPGPLAPARELYGEMLFDSGDFGGALAAFEATLRNEPNRFRATAGAARAARALNDSAKARIYSSKLLELCAHGDQPGRPEVIEARSMR